MSKNTAARAAGKDPHTILIWLERAKKAKESHSKDKREEKYISFFAAYTRAWNEALAECEETYRKGATAGFKVKSRKTVLTKVPGSESFVQNIIDEEREVPPDLNHLRYLLATAAPERWSAKRIEENPDDATEQEKSLALTAKLMEEMNSRTDEELEFFNKHNRWPSASELANAS